MILNPLVVEYRRQLQGTKFYLNVKPSFPNWGFTEKSENQYIRGTDCLKEGAWAVSRFKAGEGLAKKGVVVFLRGGGLIP